MQKKIMCPSCSSLQEYDDVHIPNGGTYEIKCKTCGTLIKRKKIPPLTPTPLKSIVCVRCKKQILYDDACLPVNTKFELWCNECGCVNIVLTNIQEESKS